MSFLEDQVEAVRLYQFKSLIFLLVFQSVPEIHSSE